MKTLRTLGLLFGLVVTYVVWTVSPVRAQTTIPNNTTLGGDTVWTLAGSPYIVEGLVIVEGSAGAVASLTIEPGVEVRFRLNGSLRVGRNGRGVLNAVGSAGAPIRFTADTDQPQPGFWLGIVLGDRIEDSSVLEQLIVEYAGRNNTTAIDIQQSSPTLRNVTVQHNGRIGIAVNDGSPVITATQVLSNADAGISLNQSSPVIANSTLGGNLYGIFSTRSSPMVRDNEFVGNTVYSLYFRNTTNAIIEANMIDGGLFFENGVGGSTLRDNEIAVLPGQPLRVNANAVGALFADNQIADLTPAGVFEVLGDTVSQDADWPTLTVPYRIVGDDVRIEGAVDALAVLTLEPGSTLEFARDRRLQIGVNGRGALVATGTPTAPITFTAASPFPQAGDWLGLHFGQRAEPAATQLAYIAVHYAGRSNNLPSIWFDRAALTLQDSVVYNSAAWGIRVSNTTGVISRTQVLTTTQAGIWAERSDLTLADSHLQNNEYGVYIQRASPRLFHNRIVMPLRQAIFVEGETNAVITDNEIDNGLFLGDGGVNAVLTGNVITLTTDLPLRVGANLVGTLLVSNTVTNTATLARIEVAGETLNQSATWPRLGIPYHIVNSNLVIEGNVTLTVTAGVELQFGNDLALTVGERSPGALVAVGTGTDPITFTTAARFPRPGAWRGLAFGQQTDHTQTQLAHLVIRYGGQHNRTPALWFNRTALTIHDSVVQESAGWGIRVSNAAAVISNTLVLTTTQAGVWVERADLTLAASVVQNGEYGVYITAAAPVITDNQIIAPRLHGIAAEGQTNATIRGNRIDHGLFLRDRNSSSTLSDNILHLVADQPLRINANMVGLLMSGNKVENLTALTMIQVVGEAITQSATWPNTGIPYRILNADLVVESNSTLTLTAGVELQFDNDLALTVGERSPGALVAVGTGTDPITFTAAARFPRSGDWRGLTFGPQTDAAATELAHLVIAYGGQRNRSAGLWFDRTAGRLRDSIVRDSDGWGIRVSNAAAVITHTQVLTTAQHGVFAQRADLTLADSVVVGAEYGVYLQQASPRLSNNRILASRQYGLFAEGSSNAIVNDNLIEQGLFFRDGSSGAQLTGNTVFDVATFPLRMGANSWAPFLAANTVSGLAESAAIELVGERLNTAATWDNLGPPYTVVNAALEVWADGAPVTLTLTAGVVLKFDNRAFLAVGNGPNRRGTLIARGTDRAPVVFTSEQAWPQPGDWRGIELRNGASNSTLVDHAIIEYGNDNIAINNSSPVVTNSTLRYAARHGLFATSFSLADVRNNTITDNGNYGIALSNFANLRIRGNTIENGIRTGTAADTSQPVITNNRFINYGGDFPVKIPFVSASGDLRGNRFEGTGANSHIQLYGAETDLTLSLTLPNLGISYVVVEKDLNISRGGQLSIEPGVELRFSRGLGINVLVDGQLVARGTPEAPIIFTAAERFPQPGGWRGITLGGRQRSFLEQCHVHFAGGGDINRGAVHVATVTNPIEPPLIQGCRIERSLSHGITIDRAQPVVMNNQFIANGGFALYNIPHPNRLPVAATHNWWGGADGPQAIGDEPGNQVSNAVTVNPWLGGPTDDDFFQRAEVVAPAFSPAGGQTLLLARLAAPATWTLAISNPAGAELVTITGSGADVAAAWDGRSNGAPLPAGDYLFRLTAQRDAEPDALLAGRFTLAPDLPAAAIVAPAPGDRLTAGVIDVRGMANAAGPLRYRLEYAPAEDLQMRTVITEITGTVDNGLLVQWDATPLTGGDYMLFLTTDDSEGGLARVHIPLSIESIAVEDVALSSHALNPQAGETVTVSYTLRERAAVTVTFGEHVALAGAVQDAGPHAAVWNGRNTAGDPVADGAYFFAIEARTPDGRRGVYVEPPTPWPIHLNTQSVIQNRVDGTLQVTYAPTQPVNIRLAYGTPPRPSVTGELATVVAHEPRPPGRQTEVWQYGSPENFNPQPIYHPPLIARVSTGGGGGGGGGGEVAVAFVALPLPPFPPPPAPPPKNFNPNAEYLVNLSAWALPGNVVIVRTPPFDVKPVFAEPAVIIPTFGQVAEIQYTLSHNAQVEVTIMAPGLSGLMPIRTLQPPTDQAAGLHHLLWDGRDDSGHIVRTGRYIYVITATGPDGQTRTRRGEIRIAF